VAAVGLGSGTEFVMLVVARVAIETVLVGVTLIGI
jgi:hypothetical protein